MKQRREPGPGQESVWDYPRPPRMEDVDKKVKAVFGGVTIAYTSRAKRVLETSHPPVFYVPPEDVRMEYFSESSGTSYCEWKGRARYYDISVDDEITGEKKSERNAAWFYPEPVSAFAELKDHVAFYPSKMDNCWVGGEKVESQAGNFYGGWVTSEIVGPFKGSPGTWGW